MRPNEIGPESNRSNIRYYAGTFLEKWSIAFGALSTVELSLDVLANNPFATDIRNIALFACTSIVGKDFAQSSPRHKN